MKSVRLIMHSQLRGLQGTLLPIPQLTDCILRQVTGEAWDNLLTTIECEILLLL